MKLFPRQQQGGMRRVSTSRRRRYHRCRRLHGDPGNARKRRELPRQRASQLNYRARDVTAGTESGIYRVTVLHRVRNCTEPQYCTELRVLLESQYCTESKILHRVRTLHRVTVLHRLRGITLSRVHKSHSIAQSQLLQSQNIVQIHTRLQSWNLDCSCYWFGFLTQPLRIRVTEYTDMTRRRLRTHIQTHESAGHGGHLLFHLHRVDNNEHFSGNHEDLCDPIAAIYHDPPKEDLTTSSSPGCPALNLKAMSKLREWIMVLCMMELAERPCDSPTSSSTSRPLHHTQVPGLLQHQD
jgi:hypothetical protein